MSGWFDTAASVFRRRVDDAPQTFEIRCACGRTVSGLRSRHAQTVVCEACRNTLFVLPASVYPLPRTSRKALAPKAETKVDRNPAEPPASKRSPRTATARRSGRTPAGDAVTPAPADEPAPDRIPLPTPQSDEFPRLRRRWLTPVRGVLSAVVCVITLTGWWLIHLRTLDQARDVLVSTPRLAEEALSEGEFHEAARQFSRIVAAVDLLGRDDHQSQQWRQAARETTAISELASVSLHEILDEAAHCVSGADRDHWLELFRGTYRGTWVVIDAPVSRNEEGSDGPRFTVDFPLAVGDCGGRLLADLPIFEQCIPPGSQGKRVIFAGQIESCRLIPGSEPVWQIELRSQTAILWGGAETYEKLGLPIDEGTARILIEQSRLMGIES